MTTRRLAIHDRHILLAFVGAVAVAICWGRLAFVSEATSISSLFEDRHVGANVGELLAVLALYSVALSVRQELPLSTRDLLAIALTSVAFATPSLSAAAVPMTVV